MKDITTALMQQFRREHKAARRYMALLLALALLTSLFVNWQLHSVGRLSVRRDRAPAHRRVL